MFTHIVERLLKGKYGDLDLTPPQGVRDAARRGLELRREHGRGGLSTKQAKQQGIGSGVQRAVNLANGNTMSPRTVRRMASFFARHRVYKEQGHHEDKTSAAYISWLMWGGDAGDAWARKLVTQMNARDKGDA